MSRLGLGVRYHRDDLSDALLSMFPDAEDKRQRREQPAPEGAVLTELVELFERLCPDLWDDHSWDPGFLYIRCHRRSAAETVRQLHRFLIESGLDRSASFTFYRHAQGAELQELIEAGSDAGFVVCGWFRSYRILTEHIAMRGRDGRESWLFQEDQ